MTNVIIIARDRPNLTRQTLESLWEHTDPKAYNCTIIDDGSQPETRAIIDLWGRMPNWLFDRFEEPTECVGQLKNFGTQVAAERFRRGDFLYFSDNDIYFTEGWLPRLQNWCIDKMRIIGGQRHPFHQENGTIGWYWSGRPIVPITEKGMLQTTDAVAGYSMLMRWDTWDKYGPFDANATGVCKSEDFAFCQKIVKDGGIVGYIDPPVLYHCGLTNSEGNPAIGSEQFERVEGILYE